MALTERDISCIATKLRDELRDHPIECRLGLDESTVTTLKEMATAYRAGKRSVLVWFFRVGLIAAALALAATVKDHWTSLSGFIGRLLGK